MEEHEKYMRRALQLAALGRGKVAPNPMVGCVIVANGKIIGEGFHQRHGAAHAEVNAVKSVERKDLLKKATLYVTLEPCSHFGKTPPCADLIVKHNIPQVVVCNHDPNPLVAGKGLQKLRTAGIEVTENVLTEEGEKLNVRFFVFMRKKRPFVLLKWAQTADGFMARADGSSKWISHSLSRKWVHKFRAEEAAIMVGNQTVLHDNPSLTTRDWAGNSPARILIDRSGKLQNQTFKVTDGTVPSIVYHATGKGANYSENIEAVRCSFGTFWEELFADMFSRNLQSVMVEGGSGILQSLIEKGLWDEARLFSSHTTFGDGLKAPTLKNATLFSQENILDNELTIFKNRGFCPGPATA